MKSYRFRSISFALVLVLAFSFVLSACAPAPAPAPAAPAEQPEATTAPAAQEEPAAAPPAEMQKVVWVSPRGTLEVMDDFNMWVADKMGYFKDLGVEVEMQPGPLEALAVTKLIAEGQADGPEGAEVADAGAQGAGAAFEQADAMTAFRGGDGVGQADDTGADNDDAFHAGHTTPPEEGERAPGR